MNVNDIQFIPLGGAGEIGSSCFYLNIGGTGILLDCGMHPRKEGIEALPDFSLIENEVVDFALITHAHTDHLSALPFLIRSKPWVRIYSTPQTRAVAEVTLHNSVSILQEQTGIDGAVKPYTHEEIDLLIQSFHYKSYNEQFEIKGLHHLGSSGISITFHDAGHILGSACILLEYNGKKLFYTGDINLNSQSWLRGTILPRLRINTLILETTYGATPTEIVPGWKSESERLTREANRILCSGGSVLMPVFSLGKMQELLATVWKLMESNRLMKTDIFTGGIANKITRIYDYSRYNVNVTDKEFRFADIPVRDIYEIERPDYFSRNPSILLVPSGMMIRNTLSYRLGLEFMRYRNCAIFTTGYMDPDTPGYLISGLSRNDTVKFEGEKREIKVKCEIQKFRFTAHSVREDLIKITETLNPERVILVHGEADAVDWTGYTLLTRLPHLKIHAARTGKSIQL